MDLKRVEVKVTWIDAEDHDSTWVSQKEAEEFGDKETVAISLGFVISKGPKYLTIGSDYDTTNENFGTVRKIPISVIVKIEESTGWTEIRKGS